MSSKPDENSQIDDHGKEAKRDVGYILDCSVVDGLLAEIKSGNADLIDRSLRQGHTIELLRRYRAIIDGRIMSHEGEIEFLELLRDKIDIVLKDSEAPDDTPGK